MDHYQHQEDYEREPLDPSNQPYDSPSRRPPYQAYQPGPEYGFTDSPYYDSPHQRNNSNSPTRSSRQAGRYESPTRREPEAPPPPRHGDYGYASRVEPSRHHHPQHAASSGSYSQQPNITPGADNFSETAAGGMAGIAYTVADRNPRESGMDAARSTGGQVLPPPSRVQNPNLPRQTYSPRHSGYYPQTYAAQSQDRLDRDSRSSLNPFGTATNSSGGSRSSSRSPHVSMGDPYGDDPYQASTHSLHSGPRHGPTTLGMVDPNDILDDGDDGVDYGPPRGSHRNSMLSASVSDRGARPGIGAAAAVGAAAGGGASMGHMMTRPGYGNSDRREKSSDWLEQKDKRSKRWKWLIIVLVFLVIAGAIIGGVVGSLISNRKNANKESFNDDDKGDLSIDSSEIKKLLNNPDLHKVFPGMDYTPMNTQYPDCKENPPSQNNVTRDVAVLSQLTNTIRLYGTDCNQVQMVLHALKQLKMEDDIKLWMGVWQDDDDKTNKRQLQQMWDILDKYGDKPFKGIIMANEILFREQMTVSALGDLMADTRKKLSAKGLKLPVATSDLGNKWDKSLTDISDYVMANVHPFFSGTPADESAKWTLDYFRNNDETYLTDKTKGIIAETGWPTGGGTACPPPQTTCSQGSVAGIDGLNEFMDGWVCSSLEKNINYFWFSAFDEPWKVRFNQKGQEWEDKWGLMDVDRNLKKGVKIPDCGGKTI